MIHTNLLKQAFIFLFVLMFGISMDAQNTRSESFGPLFDEEGMSHDQLIGAGWIYLFDGRVPSPVQTGDWQSLNQWRPRRVDANNYWVVVREDQEKSQRILSNNLSEGLHGTDLISTLEFQNFDLHVEFRSAENSGIYLRGRYEVQIDAGSSRENELQFSDLGGIYAVMAPMVNAAKAPTDWQTFDISIRDYHITVYLNGILVQDHVLIPEGKRRMGTGTELGCWPSDGFHNDPSRPGPVMIQGNHGRIDIKNIRIRTVPSL